MKTIKKRLFLVITVIVIVSLASLIATYQGGEDITLSNDKFEAEDYVIELMKDGDGVVVHMASFDPKTRLAVDMDGYYSSILAPGFSSPGISTQDFNSEDFKIKVYKKWLGLIWVPYRDIDPVIDGRQLPVLDDNSYDVFAAEFARKYMQYKVK